METWQAIVLGVVQGLTEFLPISSSGHLLIVPWLFDWGRFGGDVELERAFDVALHLGTTLALIAVFRKELLKVVGAALNAIRRKPAEPGDVRLGVAMAIATVPGVIIGALFDDWINEHMTAIGFVAGMLVLFGIVMWIADRTVPAQPQPVLSVKRALILGTAQAVALAPGVSRSGVTITTGRFLGFDRENAARISFLLAIPITIGALVYKAAELWSDGGVPQDARSAFFWGVVSSGITGFLAIIGLLRFLKTQTLLPFVIYRFVVAALILSVLVVR
jgi:undecaprenyl-diphosphatase